MRSSLQVKAMNSNEGVAKHIPTGIEQVVE
jgi:hypothetical protein